MGQRYRRMERDKHPARKKDTPVEERIRWAKERWREDPNISLNGRAGMHQRMKFVFGVSAHNDQLAQARAEVMAEKPLNPVLKPEQVAALKRQPVVVPKPLQQPAQVKSAETTDWNPTSALKPVIITGNEVPPPLVTEIHGGGGSHTAAEDKHARLGTGNGQAHSAERIRFARNFIVNCRTVPRVAEVRDAVKREFGVGLNGTHIAEIIREQTGRTKRRIRTAMEMAASPVEVKPEPPFNPPPATRPGPPNPDEQAAADIRAAIEMLVEQVPRLRTLTLKVVNGKPQAEFELEVVKVAYAKLEW